MIKITLFLSTFVIASFAQSKNVDIKMLSTGKAGAMVFEPDYIKVDKGDTVTFIPTNPSHAAQSVYTPEGANTWKGKIDEKITVKMSKDGVYIYECEPHAAMAMVGVIQVGASSNMNAAKKFASTYEKKFILNKTRLQDAMKKVK